MSASQATSQAIGPTVASLSRDDVVATVGRLRAQLADVLDEVTRLYHGRAWLSVGYPTWQAFTAAELPELAALGQVDKRGIVVELRRAGASLRAAGQTVDVSAATAKTWADEAGVRLATVTSLDGRVRPGAVSDPSRGPEGGRARPRRKPRTDRVVELLAAAGPDGLTVAEVGRALRWGREVVAPTLTRLAQQSRVQYAAPARRGQFGRYVRRINP